MTGNILFASGTNVVSAGLWHTCAVVSGVAYCWGQNVASQLGVGETISQTHEPMSVLLAK